MVLDGKRLKFHLNRNGMHHMLHFFNGFRIPNTVCNEMVSINVITESTATILYPCVSSGK